MTHLYRWQFASRERDLGNQHPINSLRRRGLRNGFHCCYFQGYVRGFCSTYLEYLIQLMQLRNCYFLANHLETIDFFGEKNVIMFHSQTELNRSELPIGLPEFQILHFQAWYTWLTAQILYVYDTRKRKNKYNDITKRLTYSCQIFNGC